MAGAAAPPPTLGAGEDPPVCALVKSFVTRQGIIAIAGIIFFAFTYVRVRLQKEQRDLQTFVADVSKQGWQQMMGGTLMVLMGLHLSERGLSPLAWYGAQYPFEIVITTVFTGLFRRWVENGARRLESEMRWSWLKPYGAVGRYGPRGSGFRCDWYLHQLVQAILLIGLPARVVALGSIFASITLLPAALSPVPLLGAAWFESGLSCDQQTIAILYVLPVTGDAIQFIIIDQLQAFHFTAERRASTLADRTSTVQGNSSDSEENGQQLTHSQPMAARSLLSANTRSDARAAAS